MAAPVIKLTPARLKQIQQARAGQLPQFIANMVSGAAMGPAGVALSQAAQRAARPQGVRPPMAGRPQMRRK